MKFFILSLLILTASQNSFAKDFLSPAQKKMILDRFDDQSSDNLDEGDCIVAYKNLICSDQQKGCTLFWRFDECAEKGEVTPVGLNFSCTLKNVTSFTDIENRGFEQVMDCVENTVSNEN